MKRKVMLFLAMISMVTFMLTPVVSQATTTIFENGQGGLRAANIDGTYYYDIYDGDDAKRVNTDYNVKFLKDVLTSSYINAEGKEEGSLLNYWSQLAYLILQNNEKYSADLDNVSGDFAKNFGKRGDSAGYTDIVYGLQYVGNDGEADSSYRKGSAGKDNTWYSGLTYAKSLNEVRNKVGESLKVGINSKRGGDNWLKPAGLEILPALKSEDKRDVYYTLITAVDRDGGTFKYFYNVFGLVFYDFQLSMIADDQIAYKTAADEYGSIEEAAKMGKPNVSYKKSGDSNIVTSFYSNDSKEDAEVSMEFTEEESITVSNTMESTKSYSFSQMIGSETEIGEAIPLLGNVKETIKLEFTAEEAFSTAYSETKEKSKTSSNTVSTTMNLPAQTAVAMDSCNQQVTVKLGYDSPVAVTFKVAIIATQGECYDGINLHFSTVDYQQGYFSTIFGGTQGDAMTDLYERALVYYNTSGYESSLGATEGVVEYQEDGDKPFTTSTLDWKGILGGKPVEKSDEQTIIVNCHLVDDDGNSDIEKALKSVSTTGTTGGTITVEAPDLSAYGYELYKGAVKAKMQKSEDGEYETFNANNTYAGDTDSKTLVVGEAVDDNSSRNTISFYYKKTESTGEEIPEELPLSESKEAPAPPENPQESDTEGTATSGKISNMIGSNDLVNWLSKHCPMSTTGGTIEYASKSLSANIAGIVPLYPLNKIKLAQGQNDEYDMISGDVLSLTNVETEGLNAYSVPYYGYDSDLGYWILVDEDGVEIPKSAGIATIVEGKNGSTKLVAGDYDGTVYLKYQIDEDSTNYTSKGKTTAATNESIGDNTAIIQINISKIPFEGAVVAEGTLTGYVNDTPINLMGTDDIDGYVLDKTEKQINVPVVWEAQRNSDAGILIENNQLTFTKTGDFNIRATYKDQYSNWIKVTAKAEKALNKIQISEAGSALAKEYILHDGTDKFDLSLLEGTLKAYDQYDNDWTKLDNLKWYYASGDGAAVEAAGDIMTVTADGTYRIYAECDGVKSNEITFTVLPERSVKALTIADDNNLLADYILNDGNNKFNLGTLTKSAEDQYDKEWTNFTNLKWYYVLGEGAPAEVTGGNLQVTEAGDYTIYAECNGVKSNSLTLKVLPARAIEELTISDENELLADYILNDGNNKFNLGTLTKSAEDQYGDEWTDFTNLKWYYVLGEGAPVEVTGGNLQVTEAGDYTIHAECNGVKSNELALKVLPARELASITVDGKIPTLTTNTTFNNHRFNLNSLTIKGFDQYEDEFEIPASAEWQLVTGDSYAKLENGTITGLVTGNGSVKYVCGNVESREISFTVDVVPYIAELYCHTDADYVVEGEAFDLSDVTLSAKDQWNKDYDLSEEQLASVVWTLDPAHSTVDADKVTIADGKVTVAEGTLDYADTLKLNLVATIADRGDGQGSVADYVEVQVRQQQILTDITIGLVDEDKVLKAEENCLIPEFFTISAKDQYGKDFAITHADVEWTSSNEDAFYIKNNALYAKNPDESAVITASAENSIDETVTSNGIEMDVPGIEKIADITIENAPEGIIYGTVLSVKDLAAVVTSNYGREYTAEELAEYPAKIMWTVKDGDDTGTKINSSNGDVTFGDIRGEVKIVAMVVNSATDKIAETEVTVHVGPYVEAVTPDKTSLNSNGGSVNVKVTGLTLSDGMTVSAFDEDGNIVEGITAVTKGTDKEQKSVTALKFPSNTDTEKSVKYIIKVLVEGEEYDALPIGAVEVAKASSVIPGGGGAGGGGFAVESFKITSTAGEGGTITDSMEVTQGKNAVFTITPDEGYEIDVLKVDGNEVEAAETYTFEKVKANHTIEVTFKKTESDSPFSDVSGDDWYSGSVEYVVDKGLMKGISEDLFGPDLQTTRAMIVTILYRLEGEPAVDNGVSFEDVADDAYYADPVAWAQANGIVKGYSDTVFGPDNEITREQMAAILYRYSEYKGYDLSAAEDTNILSYEDAADVSGYAMESMQWACGSGLIKGNNKNELNPGGKATRAEVATILTRFCEL